jgi:hypothetical protein
MFRFISLSLYLKEIYLLSYRVLTEEGRKGTIGKNRLFKVLSTNYIILISNLFISSIFALFEITQKQNG